MMMSRIQPHSHSQDGIYTGNVGVSVGIVFISYPHPQLFRLRKPTPTPIPTVKNSEIVYAIPASNTIIERLFSTSKKLSYA